MVPEETGLSECGKGSKVHKGFGALQSMWELSRKEERVCTKCRWGYVGIFFMKRDVKEWWELFAINLF